MEAATPPPAQPPAEPDPFAEDAAAAAEPAPLPEPPAADVPVEEPPPAAQPEPVAAEPEDAEHVEALPGEGEDREADAPAEPPAAPAEEPPAATGAGEEAPAQPPADPPAQDAAQQAEPANKNRERDYTLLEKVGLGELLTKLGINAESLGEVADVLVYHPIHEVTARNQEVAITRTFTGDGPHSRAYKGEVATLPTSSLATKTVEVGVTERVSVQIH
jgi:hypothetical protein